MAGATSARSRQSGRVRQHGRTMARAGNRLLLVLLAGLIIRLTLAPFGSFAQDANTMRSWAVRLATQPMSEFYGQGTLTDHLPGDLWFLWLIANIYELFSPEMRVRETAFLVLLKFVPAVADIGIGTMLYLLGRRLGGERTGLLAALFFVFNPASIFLTSVWGQWDSVSAFFALTAVWLLVRGNVEWSFPVLTYAAIIKPPFAGLLPLFALVAAIQYVLPHTRWARQPATEPLARTAWRAAMAIAASMAVLLMVLLPFGVGLPLMGTRWTIFERMRYALDVYPYTTLNAFTLWGLPIGGNWKRDTAPFLLGVTYQTWGTLLLLAAVGYVLYAYWRRRSDGVLVWALVATLFALFMLPTRGHERYLFPAVAFACLLAALFPRLRWFLAALSVVYLGNLYWVYDYYNPALGLEGAFSLSRVVFVGALANLFLFVYLFVRAPALIHEVANRAGTTVNARRGNRRAAAGARPAAPEPTARESSLLRRRLRYLLPALVFLVALGLYLPRLGAAGRYYFDEVYFAYTAGQYVRGDAAAYIGRGDPPQRPEIATHRTYYEWTHPPLGKLLIAGGILTAGDRPVGWRIANTLFGAAGAVLAYLLASTLSRSRAIGVLAAGLLLLDGVYFAEARTGKVDIFVLVFTLAALLGLYRYLNAPPARIHGPLLWTGLAMGLGLATKWSAVYASALIGIVVLVRAYRLWQETRRPRSGAEAGAALRQHLIWVPVALMALPLGVYALSYLPFLLAGHGVSDAIAQQSRMFRYHTNLVGNHPYKSRWWTWPLNLRPVLYYIERPGQLTTAIYASGNVLLYWCFLPAVAWLVFRWWDNNRRALVVLLIGFFGQWLPWMLSPRSSYIYHFLPAVPFGCIAVAALAVDLWRRGGRWRVFVACYMTLTILTFLFYYPIYSALPLTGSEFDARMWIRSWR